MGSIALADSGTQTSVRPAPCPLWKIAISPAVVAVAAAPLLISSKPALPKTLSSSSHPSLFYASRGPAPHARLLLQEFSMAIFQA